MNGNTIKHFIDTYGDEIEYIGLDNRRSIFLNQEGKPTGSELTVETIGGEDFLVVPQKDIQANNYFNLISFKEYHPVGNVQFISILREGVIPPEKKILYLTNTIGGVTESTGFDSFDELRAYINENKLEFTGSIILYNALPISESYTLSYLFEGVTNVTSLDINSLDTSKCTELDGLCMGMTSLTEINFDKINVSNVVTYENMLHATTNLSNIDISTWDLNISANVNNMFKGAISLPDLLYAKSEDIAIKLNNRPVSGLEEPTLFYVPERGDLYIIANIGFGVITEYFTSFSEMSEYLATNKANFTGNLKLVNENVIDSDFSMTGLFEGNTADSIDLSEFDSDYLMGDLSSLFKNSSATSINLTGFNTSRVTSMSAMFSGSKLLTIDISNLDTSNVLDMSAMYEITVAKSIVFSENTSKVTTMNGMFRRNSGLTSIDLSKLDTSSVIDMQEMFSQMTALTSLNVSPMVTSNVTNMSYMFYNTDILEILDLKTFDTSKVTTMNYMFYNASGIKDLGLESFDTSLASVSQMFTNATSLERVMFARTQADADKLNNRVLTKLQDSSKFIYEYNTRLDYTIGGVTSYDYYDDIEDVKAFISTNKILFEGTLKLTTTKPYTKEFNMDSMFRLVTADVIDLNDFDTSLCNSFVATFIAAKSSSILVENLNIQNATDLISTFSSCINITSLNLSKWDVTNIKNFSRLFYNCNNLISVDISTWQPLNVGVMDDMFRECTSLTGVTFNENFTIPNCVLLERMFAECSSITSLNLSMFDTSYVHNFAEMFAGCTNLTDLNISSFDVHSTINRLLVPGTNDMFLNAVSLPEFMYASTQADADILNTREITKLKDTSSFILQEAVDKSELEKLVEEIEKLNPDDYSEETWNKLQEDLENAKNIIDDPNATQDDVNNAAENLEKTESELEDKLLLSITSDIGEGTIITQFDSLSNVKEYISLNKASFINTLKIESNDDRVNTHALDLSNMFNGVSAETIDISGLNITNIINTSHMYDGALSTSLILGKLDYTSVTDMSYMFANMPNITSLDLFFMRNNPNANLTYMFANTPKLNNLIMSNINTNNDTNIYSMFSGASALPEVMYANSEFDAARFNNRLITVLKENTTFEVKHEMIVFYNDATTKEEFRIDFQTFEEMRAWNFNKSLNSDYLKVINKNPEPTLVSANNMFNNSGAGTHGLGGYFDLTEFDTTYVNDMSLMFYLVKIEDIRGLEDLNTENVTTMYRMFYFAGSVLELAKTKLNWNTSNLTNTSEMFYKNTITDLDLSSWDTSKLTNYSNMFIGSSINGIEYGRDFTSIAKFNNRATSGLPNNAEYIVKPELSLEGDMGDGIVKVHFLNLAEMKNYLSINKAKFSGNLKLVNINMITSNIDITGLLEGNTASSIDLSVFDVYHTTSLENLFRNCPNLTSYTPPYRYENITNISGMFEDCSSIESISLEWLEDNDITAVDRTFKNTTSLVDLDIFFLDSLKATVSEMFTGASSLPETLYAYDQENADIYNNRSNTGLQGTSTFMPKPILYTRLNGGDKVYYDTFEEFKANRPNSGNIKIVHRNGLIPPNTSADKLFENTFANFIDFSDFDISCFNSFYRTFNTSYHLTSVVFSDKYRANVLNIQEMFRISVITNVDLSFMDTENCTNMQDVFAPNTNTNSLLSLDISSFNVENANIFNMLRGSNKIPAQLEAYSDYDANLLETGGIGIIRDFVPTQEIYLMYNIGDGETKLDFATIDEMKTFISTNASSFIGKLEPVFKGYPSVQFSGESFFENVTADEIDLTRFYMMNITSAKNMFKNTPNITSINNRGIGSSVTDVSGMFMNSNIESINLGKIATNNVTNMSNMFNGSKISECKFSDSNVFTTANDTSFMLANCENLTDIELKGMIISDATNINSMFENSNSLTEIQYIDEPPFAVLLNNREITKLKEGTSFKAKPVLYVEGDIGQGIQQYHFDNITDMKNWLYTNRFSTTAKKVVHRNGAFPPRTDIWELFKENRASSLDLSEFDVTNLLHFGSMFYRCYSASINLSNWNTSNCTLMSHMFQECYNITTLDLSHFDVSNVSNMTHLFYGSTKLANLNVSTWNTFNVTIMNLMFYNCDGLRSLDISSFATYSISDISQMFSAASYLPATMYAYTDYEATNFNNRTWSGLKTSSTFIVTPTISITGNIGEGEITTVFATLDEMKTYIQTNKSLFTGRLKAVYKGHSGTFTMESMFEGVTANEIDLLEFNMLNVTSFRNTFKDTVNARNIIMRKNSENVVDMHGMYRNSGIETIDTMPLRLNSTIDASYMFEGCKNLTEISMHNNVVSPVVENMSYMFANCPVLVDMDLHYMTVRESTNLENMFLNSNALAEFLYVYKAKDRDILNNREVTKLKDGSSFKAEPLLYVEGDIGQGIQQYHFDNITDMKNWLTTNRYSRTNKKIVHQENVIPQKTSAWRLFYQNYANTIDLTEFDMTNITVAGGMFDESRVQNIIFGKNANTSNITNMDYMFSRTWELKSIDLENLNTSSAILMNHMFLNSYITENLDFSNFDTSKVTTMEGMFQSCKMTSLNLQFNTSNVTTMNSMFREAVLTSLDISYFDVSKVSVANSQYMFLNANSLPAVLYAKDQTTADFFNNNRSTNRLRTGSSFQVIIHPYTLNYTLSGENLTESFVRVFELKDFIQTNKNNLSGHMKLINNNPTDKDTNLDGVFSNLTLDSLDLTDFDAVYITSMKNIFENSTITHIDLGWYYPLTNIDLTDAFLNATVTTGYGYRQESVDVLNNAEITKISSTVFRVLNESDFDKTYDSITAEGNGHRTYLDTEVKYINENNFNITSAYTKLDTASGAKIVIGATDRAVDISAATDNRMLMFYMSTPTQLRFSYGISTYDTIVDTSLVPVINTDLNVKTEIKNSKKVFILNNSTEYEFILPTIREDSSNFILCNYARRGNVIDRVGNNLNNTAFRFSKVQFTNSSDEVIRNLIPVTLKGDSTYIRMWDPIEKKVFKFNNATLSLGYELSGELYIIDNYGTETETRIDFLNYEDMKSWLYDNKESTSAKKVVHIGNMIPPNSSGYQLFYQNKSVSLDVSEFDVTNIITFGSMFRETTVEQLDLSTWNTVNVTAFSDMFRDSKVKYLDLSSWKTDNLLYMGYFIRDSLVEYLNMDGWNTENLQSMNNSFANATLLTELYMPTFTTAKLTSISNIFSNIGNVPLVMYIDSEESATYFNNRKSTIGLRTDINFVVSKFLYNITYSLNEVSEESNFRRISEIRNFIDDNRDNLSGDMKIKSFDTYGIDSKFDNLFTNLTLDSLDLSELDTYPVKSMKNMFENSNISHIDLGWLTPISTVDLTDVFTNATINTGYVYRQESADLLNNSVITKLSTPIFRVLTLDDFDKHYESVSVTAFKDSINTWLDTEVKFTSNTDFILDTAFERLKEGTSTKFVLGASDIENGKTGTTGNDVVFIYYTDNSPLQCKMTYGDWSVPDTTVPSEYNPAANEIFTVRSYTNASNKKIVNFNGYEYTYDIPDIQEKVSNFFLCDYATSDNRPISNNTSNDMRDTTFIYSKVQFTVNDIIVRNLIPVTLKGNSTYIRMWDPIENKVFKFNNATLTVGNELFINASIITDSINETFTSYSEFAKYIQDNKEIISGDVKVTFKDDKGIVSDVSNLFDGINVNTLDLINFDITNITDTTDMFANSTIMKGIANTKFDADIFNNPITGINSPVFEMVDYRILYNQYESITILAETGKSKPYLDTKIPISMDINYEVSLYYSNPLDNFKFGIVGGLIEPEPKYRYISWVSSGALKTNAGLGYEYDSYSPTLPATNEIFTISTTNTETNKIINLYNTEFTFPLINMTDVGTFYIGNMSENNKTENVIRPLWELSADLTYTTIKFKDTNGNTFMNLVPVTPKDDSSKIYMINTLTNELYEFNDASLSLGHIVPVEDPYEYPTFEIDTNGDLVATYQTDNRDLTFEINTNGDLVGNYTQNKPELFIDENGDLIKGVK